VRRVRKRVDAGARRADAAVAFPDIGNDAQVDLPGFLRERREVQI